MPAESGRTVTSNNKDVLLGNLCPIPNLAASLPIIRNPKQLGRFSTSFELPKPRGEPAKRPMPRTVFEANICQEICSHLLEPCSNGRDENIALESTENAEHGTFEEPRTLSPWSSMSNTQLFAEPGHVLHETQGNNIRETLSISELLERNSTSHSFSPTIVGLPQFLLKNCSNSEMERKDFLRIPLIPSPWSSKDLKGVPKLEMILTVDYSSRTTELESITAILNTRSVNVMLPDLGMDVRFLEEDVLQMIHPIQVPNVREFVRQIQDTAVGYGNIRPPLFLRLPNPQQLKTHSAVQDEPSASGFGAHQVDVDYMSTGIEYVESVVYDFKGQELILQRVGGGEFVAKYGGLRMRNVSHELSSEKGTMKVFTQDTNNSHPQPKEVQSFISGPASLLLRELNLAWGNLNMLEMNPKLADFRHTEQRKSDMSASYRTRQIRPNSGQFANM